MSFGRTATVHVNELAKTENQLWSVDALVDVFVERATLEVTSIFNAFLKAIAIVSFNFKASFKSSLESKK